ncbi:DUF4097 family beta strand repeat protein [candidate division KSB1 bacterium]|nr:DUF4097 family beta strand repeat protein [candidate division KSB1 bacterium]
MKSKMFFFVLVLVLISTLLFAQDLKKAGRYYVAEIEKKFDVSKGGNLIMDDIRGDVHITTWNKNVVQINETRKMDVYTEHEAKAVLKDLKSIYKQSGNTVKVGAEGSYRSYMSSKFKIVVPTVFNVDVDTKGGDVSVADLQGEVKLNTSGGDLNIKKIDGVVNAKTSGGDVTVEKTTKDVTVKTSGGDIELLDVEGEVNAKTSGGDIEIKNNKAKVVAKTSGGTIELTNVGAEIDAHTSGGDIIVNGSKGSLAVSTSGGDIELKNINDVINAKTSGGDIEADNVLNGIKAKTSGGDIKLEDIKGFIEAATSGGDVEAEMTLTDFSKDHHVTLRSSGGNLKLYIPAKLPATIDATIKISGSSMRDYNILSDFPFAIENIDDSKDRRGRHVDLIHSQGKINGGGDLIKLETSNGNIEIRKLGN